MVLFSCSTDYVVKGLVGWLKRVLLYFREFVNDLTQPFLVQSTEKKN